MPGLSKTKMVMYSISSKLTLKCFRFTTLWLLSISLTFEILAKSGEFLA